MFSVSGREHFIHIELYQAYNKRSTINVDKGFQLENVIFYFFTFSTIHTKHTTLLLSNLI